MRAPQFDSHSENGQRPTKSKRLETRCEKSLIAWRRERAPMPSLRQLEFAFRSIDILSASRTDSSGGESVGQPGVSSATARIHRSEPSELAGKMSAELTAETAALQKARELLRPLGAARIANELRVEWNPRLKTAAGR